MPIVAEKCKRCDAPIYFENDCDTAVCQYCGTQNHREDTVINNYQNNNFSGANVIMNDINAVDNQLQNAEVYLTKIKDYNKAEKIYRDLAQKASGEYRCWWGLVRAISNDFTIVTSKNDYDQMYYYAKNAYYVTDDKNIKKQIKTQWNNYNEYVAKINSEKLNEYSNVLYTYSNEIKNTNIKIDEFQAEIDNNLSSAKLLVERINKGEKIGNTLSTFFIIMCVFFGCVILFAAELFFENYMFISISITVILCILLISIFWFKKSNNRNISIRKQKVKDLKEEYENCISQIENLRLDISSKNRKVQDVESSIKYFNNFSVKEI